MRACLGLPGMLLARLSPDGVMHVLVVHSDPRFYHELRGLLSSQEATGAYLPNLSELRAQIEAHFPELIVLEQRCLGEGGAQLGHAFATGRLQRLPIIYLTSADCERMRGGEELHRLTDLLAHVRSQTERARVQQVTQIGRLRIHSGRMRVALDNRWVRLPPTQFRILQHLAANPNVVISHRELISVVWGAEAVDDEARRDALKVHMRHLRRMLGPDTEGYIQTIRGQGYALIDPDADE
jgi:DNA-binding response OmpR family regulator